MKPHQQAVIDELRQEGYAIGIFYPFELGEASPRDLEDILVKEGNDAIEILNPEQDHE